MALDNFRTIELIWDKANKSIIKTIKTASSDTTGRYLSVKILDGGQEVDLTGATLQLYWEHPNFNTTGIDDFEVVNNFGLFKLTFSKEMLTNVGELNAHLVLTLSDGTITSDGFPIQVFKGADDGVVVPTNGSGLVEQIDGKIDKGNVTLNDLTQEVKLAMTGGSVAVVGENSVGAENIKDGVVTLSKLSPEIVDVIEFDNIIKNPDFSNLSTLSRPLYWGASLGDTPSANGVMNFTATGVNGNVFQNLTVTTGNKYFVHVEVSGTATGYVDYYEANSIKISDLNTDGAFNKYEGVFTATSDARQRLRVVNVSGSGTLRIKNPVLIDLTAEFGAGNEPDLIEMSRIYGQSSTSDLKTYNFQKLNATIIPEVDFKKPIKVSISSSRIYYSTNYGLSDKIIFSMAKKGPNSIFDFSTIKTSSGNLSYQNSSDFFGPYIVKALNNADGDNITSGYFTGGNHGYQNSGTIGGANTPTGRTSSLAFYVDNLKVDSFDGYANIIKIVWTNHIQGYNTTKTDGTGREILKETYTLEITEQGIEVHNDIEPLEDLVIERYYGLQAQKGAWDNWYRFEGASNRKRNSWSVTSNSGDYGTTKIFSGNTSGDILEISLSNNIDLGELELATTGHNAFTSPTKAYFRLIDNSPTLTTGDIYSFEGRYRFYKI